MSAGNAGGEIRTYLDGPPLSQDEATDALTLAKTSFVAGWLNKHIQEFQTDGPTQTTLEGFASGYAALQRQMLAGLPKSSEVIKDYAPAARRILFGSGYWGEMLASIKTGTPPPSLTELQLVLMSQISTEPGMLRRDKVGRAIQALNFGGVPVLEDIGHTWMHQEKEAKEALHGFVWWTRQKHLNRGSGHLLATAFHSLIWEMGLLDADTMDLKRPHIMLLPMTEMYTGLMEQARESGEYNDLPQEVREHYRALLSFWDDVQAKNPVVGRQPGRLWRLVFDPEGVKKYNAYLKDCESLAPAADIRFTKCVGLSAPELEKNLRIILQDLQDEGDSDMHNLQLNEFLGLTWAALVARYKQNPSQNDFANVLQRHREEVVTFLEPNIHDRLRQIERTGGPFWLRYLAFQGWMDTDGSGIGTVFTPDRGSILQDRIRAGEALSVWISRVYGQGSANIVMAAGSGKASGLLGGRKTQSRGYGEQTKQLGIVAAYLLQDQYPGSHPVVWAGLFGDMRTIIRDYIKQQSRRSFVDIVASRLPGDVYDFLVKYQDGLL